MSKVKAQTSKLKSKTLIVLTLSTIILSGCMSTISFTREDLQKETDHDIIILTKDGKRIVLDEGDYNIFNGDSGFIQGKGRLYQKITSKTYTEWDSTISFQDIESITDSELNIFGYTFLISVAAVIVYWVAIAATFGPMH